MQWLTNLYDPNQKDAKEKVICYLGETAEQARQRQQESLKDKVIGDPKGTADFTVKELKAMGMVGVYQPD